MATAILWRLYLSDDIWTGKLNENCNTISCNPFYVIFIKVKKFKNTKIRCKIMDLYPSINLLTPIIIIIKINMSRFGKILLASNT